MATKLTPNAVTEALQKFAQQGKDEVTSSELLTRTGGSSATLKRLLEQMVSQRQIVRTGKARATRYRLPEVFNLEVREVAHVVDRVSATITPPWSPEARALLDKLRQPLAARRPVTYERKFVDEYVPNESSLLTQELADMLASEGGMRDQQPAGTYARKVLEQLLIDLSWSSSKLEGNPYTLLATKELFESGAKDGDANAVMLLNHKRAIEFIVDAVPEYGLTMPVIRNLHALLMQDLLADSAALGATRKRVVNITHTTYIPTQVPMLIDEMLNSIVERARLIKNPAEAAFFLWVNIAYLQPFEDGNKRTSRLSANIPLLLYNCAPLSFLDVDQNDYALAMIGIYELLDVSAARDLFTWTYRRSIKKYEVVLKSLEAPDQFRVRHREHLNEAIQLVVQGGLATSEAVSKLGLPTDDRESFATMLRNELDTLTEYNCARYRLVPSLVEHWLNSRQHGN